MMDIFALNPTGYAGIFSCFVTVMLSTTRALALAKPLYDIKEYLVRRAFFIFTTFLFLLLVVKDIVAYYQFLNGYSDDINSRIATTAIAGTELFIITSIITVVIFSSIVSVKALWEENSALNGQRNNYENNRSASKMIVTLSITFMIFNGYWFLWWIGIWIYDYYNETDSLAYNAIIVHHNLMMLSINSCANPIVYLVKNSGLHDYTKRGVLRFMRFVTGKLRSCIDEKFV